ncbi:MAG: DNA polymerase III subunit alpha, partial [Chitinophagales bacterium]
HSTCYAVLAFQTAYLKANYPAEFMAAVLGHNMNDIKKVTFFMEECKRLKIPVLGPDVNESSKKFTVNKKGKIRFALSAIKGVGEAAVDAIIEEREANGEYKDIYEFASRVNLRSVNKKSIESLAIAGAFDEFENCTRAHFMVADPADNCTLTEKAVKFGNSVQNSTHTAQNSLFGELAPIALTAPKIHQVEEFALIEKLNREKEIIGIYLTGHPLDAFALEVNSYATATTQSYKDKPNQVVKLAGIISSCNSRFTKKGTKFCNFLLEDFEGSMEVFLFGKDYIDFGKYAEVVGNMVFITGKYQQRPYNPEEYEFKVIKIDLLADIKDQLTNGMQLKLSLESINEEFVENILAVLENHPGQHNVSVEIIEPEEGHKISFYSKSKRVNISQDLIDDLRDLGDLEYKLN